MAEQTPVTLNHFALVRFTPAYWDLATAARATVRRDWLAAVRGAAEAAHLYQVFGMEPGTDLLLWTACRAATPEVPDGFFGRWAAAFGPQRRFIEVRETLWGFTRPSQYTKTRSTQELDPFAPGRLPYLVAYPFVKTTGWYALGAERRRELMAGHIKVGKQYPDITQLLLYSFGLQDQEFVVVYETADLLRFLELVQELRGHEARAYTQRDWPLHAGRHVAAAEELDSWL